jgi:hypothetical protein
MRDEHPRDDARGDGSPVNEAEQSALSTVGTLMEERRQYEAWLAALDARRAETPKHVFTRVHADYVARLESVVARLIAHADGLRAELTSLTTRIATLDEQKHRARDERAELELRAHVGEISAQAWKAATAASDAAIADLEAQHERAKEELQRTRELLADAERPPTPVPAAATVPESAPPPPSASPPAAPRAAFQARSAPSAPAPAAGAKPTTQVSDVAEGDMHVPSGAAPATAPNAPAAPSGPSAPGTGAGASAGNFDELAFLQSVVEAPATPAAPAAAAPAPAPIAPASPPAPAPAPRAPAPAPRREPFAARAPQDARDKIVHPEESTGPKIDATRGRSLAANISGNNPIVLREKSAEAAKTLRCAECGAMNYPTEWYCERCGAELASL